MTNLNEIILYITTLLVANTGGGVMIDSIGVTADGNLIENLYSPNPAETITINAMKGQAITIDLKMRTNSEGTLVMKSDLVNTLLYKGRTLVNQQEQPITVSLEPGLISIKLIGTVPDDTSATLLRILDADSLNQLLDVKLNGSAPMIKAKIPTVIDTSKGILSERVETLKNEIIISTLPDFRKQVLIDKISFIDAVEISDDTKLKMFDDVEAKFRDENARSSTSWQTIVNAETLLSIEGDETKGVTVGNMINKSKDEFARAEYAIAEGLAREAINIMKDKGIIDPRIPTIMLPLSLIGVVGAVLMKKRKKVENSRPVVKDEKKPEGDKNGYY